MAGRASWQLWSGFWATSLGTLASRVLGLVRDIATASLLGMGEGGVMDAFVVAFRVPNLLRRVFGEGALAASFLPVFSAEYQQAPPRAWQLLSALFAWLAIALGLFVVVAEVACLVWWSSLESGAPAAMLAGLLAAMMPYLVFVCLAAQASAALQARFEFRTPAMAPLLLNVCWLLAAWFVAPWFAPDKMAQAYVLAVAVLISGVLQLAVQLPALRRLGFRFEYDWPASRGAFWLVVRSTVPVALGLAVTQLNTLTDSLIAWGLAAEAGGARTIAWLGHRVTYPLETGAASAIYFGERFYQLPVGILGVAVATVIYPLLARHAARSDRAALSADLTLGLRLVAFLSIPASVGLMLVAHPAARVLFERGAFSADDAARAARMIAGYAGGVWAYCALPVLVRGFYAAGNRAAPARVGLVVVLVNLALNLTLIWPLGEIGLAASTAIAAALQVVLLATTYSRAVSRLLWRELFSTLGKSGAAVIVMASAVLGVRWLDLFQAGNDLPRLAAQLALEIVAGAVVYLVVARLLGMPELRLLLVRPRSARLSRPTHYFLRRYNSAQRGP